MNVWHGELEATSDQDTDPLPCLIADAEPAVLGRAVLAVAAMHEPDENGLCRVCEARRPWPWRRSRNTAACPTRRMLWVTLAGEDVAVQGGRAVSAQ